MSIKMKSVPALFAEVAFAIAYMMVIMAISVTLAIAVADEYGEGAGMFITWVGFMGAILYAFLRVSIYLAKGKVIY